MDVWLLISGARFSVSIRFTRRRGPLSFVDGRLLCPPDRDPLPQPNRNPLVSNPIFAVTSPLIDTTLLFPRSEIATFARPLGIRK